MTLRKLPGRARALVLDPLGNLVVKQQVVPLNTARDLDTFGGAPVAGAQRFTIDGRRSNGSRSRRRHRCRISSRRRSSSTMSDDEKLASPSFEEMDAGVMFGSDAVVLRRGASIVAAPLEYETIVDRRRRGAGGASAAATGTCCTRAAACAGARRRGRAGADSRHRARRASATPRRRGRQCACDAALGDRVGRRTRGP